MKLLVLAQTPPPEHGQSRAVRELLNDLRADPKNQIFHVNLHLSRNTADIGRWRPGKILALLGASLRAAWLQLRHGPMPLYYVPAPAKRAALYRDWIALAICRPLSRGLVLHWHAVGLGEWLDTHATPIERWLTRRLLGRARLAIVLADALRWDAERLAPRQCQIVPGGVRDRAPGFHRERRTGAALEILFLGLGCREKGLFDSLEGVALAQRSGLACRLTIAGAFADAEAERFFRGQAAALDPATVRHLGFVSDAECSSLLGASDVLCFPTYYPHEGQPAVLLDALAFDLPVITTRWRAIPDMLPVNHGRIRFVEPRQPAQIAAALSDFRVAPPSDGSLRAHFLAHFTQEKNLAALTAAFRVLDSNAHK